jgi:uncharacterized phage protein gp47/JayE
MPFSRPTLQQLRDRVAAAWRTRFPGADTNLRQSPDRGFVELIASSTDEDLAYLDWQKDQLFPFSASSEYLERWAATKGLARKAASNGQGMITIGGTPGAFVAPGVRLMAGQVEIETLNGATIPPAGAITIAARAVAGGAAGNLGLGAALSFVSTPPGVADSATVASVFAGGGEPEADEMLRLRVLRALAEPSFGGNRNDWERAVLAVPGVTRVYSVAAVPTPGAITLYPLFDALRINGIPSGNDAWFRPGDDAVGSGDQRAVLDSLLDRRPVCAHVYVRALVPTSLPVTVANLTTDSAATRAAVAAELQRMLRRRATPGQTISRSWVAEAVARAAGENSHDLAAPLGNTPVAAGSIAVLGPIAYV